MRTLRIAVPIALAVIAASAVHAEGFWEYTIPAGTEWREFEPDPAHGGPWVVHWLNGAMVGEVSYHERVGGQKSEERPLRNGKTHGTVRTWWPDGSPLWAKTYRSGVLHGLHAIWVAPNMVGALAYYIEGQRVRQSQYQEAWEENPTALPPPNLFGVPGSWLGGQDPDEHLSADDRSSAREAERLLNEGMDEFRKGKPTVTSGPNEVPPNPEAEALSKLQTALNWIKRVEDPRKRAELLLRAANQAITYRQKVLHYAHIQQFVDIAALTLDQVPGAVRALDNPQMRSQLYTDLSDTWRSLAKIALFQHRTLTPTYCDQKRAEYLQLAERERSSGATGGGTTAGGTTGGQTGGTAGAITLPQMHLSLTLPAGFTPMDTAGIPVMVQGPQEAVGMMIHMEPGAVDLQEFATIFMRDIGPAMGAGDLQEMGRDPVAVGEGMPGLLSIARATINNTTAEFAFLFFTANERAYTFAYFAPTASFDQHEGAFFSLLSSVSVGE